MHPTKLPSPRPVSEILNVKNIVSESTAGGASTSSSHGHHDHANIASNITQRGVTMDVMEKSTGQVRRRRGESMESCCLRVTHLRLQSKKLSHGLENIVRWCPQLKVLYAYDNFFREATVSHRVEHLFLQDNLLSSLAFVGNAQHLKYLNVANNCIPELFWIPKSQQQQQAATDGTNEQSNQAQQQQQQYEGPLRVEKINISRQRPLQLPQSDAQGAGKSNGGQSPTRGGDNSPQQQQNQGGPDAPTLILRTDFLPKLAHCLQEIAIAENRLRDINALKLLPNLRSVNAERNLIARFDNMSEFLDACRDNLETLKLSGNPYCSGNLHSWRDPIIVASPSLIMLNEKEVSENEKVFVRELAIRKKKAGKV